MNEALRNKLQRTVALFQQPSTWRGVVVALTGCGILVKPEHADAIAGAGLILAGAIAIWLEP